MTPTPRTWPPRPRSAPCWRAEVPPTLGVALRVGQMQVRTSPPRLSAARADPWPTHEESSGKSAPSGKSRHRATFHIETNVSPRNIPDGAAKIPSQMKPDSLSLRRGIIPAHPTRAHRCRPSTEGGKGVERTDGCSSRVVVEGTFPGGFPNPHPGGPNWRLLGVDRISTPQWVRAGTPPNRRAEGAPGGP